ncbi:MAG: PIG-L family deacetylase [Candidatus Diapherotrites archaeon]|nr:PIG-L family deacetylase [Candidatus Diapherotrites archaeon]
MKLPEHANALVIVAHPDDETIWMGGFILAHPNWKWHIICLSRDTDSDRAPKFRKVCKELGAQGSIHGFKDDDPLDEVQDIGKLADGIARIVGDESFDFVFFHNKNGEYGHIRHRETHAAVMRLLDDNRLRVRHAYCFAVKRDQSRAFAVPMARGALELRLSPRLLEQKRFLIHSVYGFGMDGFEMRCANAVERFRRIR